MRSYRDSDSIIREFQTGGTHTHQIWLAEGLRELADFREKLSRLLYYLNTEILPAYSHTDTRGVEEIEPVVNNVAQLLQEAVYSVEQVDNSIDSIEQQLDHVINAIRQLEDILEGAIFL